MSSSHKTIETPVSIQFLIERGILFASSPLLRGQPDPPTQILQVVTYDEHGKYYSLYYRQMPIIRQ